MNYETAQALKDAGWPQDTLHIHMHESGVEAGHVGADTALVPTLEELIEACGERFGVISQSETGRWFAAACDEGADGYRTEIKDALSPTEAVARLWLALNKKQ